MLLAISMQAMERYQGSFCVQSIIDPVLCVLPCAEADEVDSEDSIEPPHKRLCLSSEDDQSIDDTTPCISVVAVPSELLVKGPYWTPGSES